MTDFLEDIIERIYREQDLYDELLAEAGSAKIIGQHEEEHEMARMAAS